MRLLCRANALLMSTLASSKIVPSLWAFSSNNIAYSATIKTRKSFLRISPGSALSSSLITKLYSSSETTSSVTNDILAPEAAVSGPRTGQKKIAIVGSGAVGCYYGSRLWEKGYDVSFHMRGKHYERSVMDGLNVTSVAGNVFVPPDKLKAYDDIQEMAVQSMNGSGICKGASSSNDSDGFDWVIVALKSTAVDDIPALIYPLLTPTKTRVLCIMNGLIEDDIIHGLNEYHFRHQKGKSSSNDNSSDSSSSTTTASPSLSCCKALYGGMALVCCNRISPGHVDHSYAGLLSGGIAATNGNMDLDEMENKEAFERLWEPTKIDIVYEPCLLAGRWRKNCWNLPFNGVSVAMGGITVDKIVLDPALRELAHLVMDETIAVANADIQKKHKTILHGDERIHSYVLGDKEKKQMFDLSDGMGPYKTSTMIDLIERNPMEVKYLFRKPVERAKQLGVPVPHLETLVMQIEAYQRFHNLF